MRNITGDPRQLLAIAKPGSCVVTTERDQLPIGGDVLNDASPETAQIVTMRIHKVHASNEDAIEAALCPSFGSALLLVFPRVKAAQQALEGEFGRGLAPIEALR